MRKNITKEIQITEEEIYCDICKKKTSHYSVCSICNRDICHDCWQDITEINGTYIIPCPICRMIKDDYIHKIKIAWNKSDSYREKAFKIEKQWKHSSRKINI